MNRIIYEDTSGNACVVTPSPNWVGTLTELAVRSVPEGVAYSIIPTDDFPQDKLFRNAWKVSEGALVTDLPKAKLIAHEKRRVERAELFAPLDVEATIPSRAVAAEAARQVIRNEDDAKQAAIDGVVDEDELRGVM